MEKKTHFYIDGKWMAPATPIELDVINPADETAYATISLGSKADVDAAVAAADKAFLDWADTPVEERIALIEKLAEVYKSRIAEMAKAISMEMGAPIKLATNAQAAAGLGHIKAFIRSLKSFSFEQPLREGAENQHMIYEPIGVCGLITPWNWPMNQVTLKVVPALGAGCTVVLKPSEIAPMSSMLFAEFIDAAGFPPGVFNLVNGDGPGVGEAMSTHPGIDMMSFTGSTRPGSPLPRARQIRLSALRWSSVARARTSSSRMRISNARSRQGRVTASTTRGNRATRRHACWSSVRSTKKPLPLPKKLQKAHPSAIRRKTATISAPS